VEKLKPLINPATFEYLIVKLTSNGASCITVLYRPGSATITQLFYDEFESLLEVLSTMSTPCVITGDLNVRLDRPDDAHCQQFNDTLAAFGMLQHVHQPTHTGLGTLDVVVTRTKLQPTDVTVTDIGFSDHRLVQ